MHVTHVRLKEQSGDYKIIVKRGFVEKMPALVTSVKDYSRYIIVTDRNVSRCCGKRLWQVFRKQGVKAEVFVFPAGEKTKSMHRLKELYRFLLEKKCDRASCLLAFGGGVVGDITGFAAATFLRGVDYFQIPTSLMAQVDSSVGGKTGINLEEGKNLVGAFHQPRVVLADTDFLKTLPESEFQSALSEVLKYGMIMNKAFFSFLEKNVDLILKRDPEVLEKIVVSCLDMKAKVVMKDEREAGLRAILNLGHTFGHAFETLAEYRGLSHGGAVGQGIELAAGVSHIKGFLNDAEHFRIKNVLRHFQFQPPSSPGDFRKFMRIMGVDKKMMKGKNRFILPQGIGKVIITEDVSPQEIKEAFSR